MQAKILLFLKLPPPLTGTTFMNTFVAESRLLKNNFKIELIPVSYKTKIENTSALSFSKILTICRLYMRLIITLKRFKPKLVYFQISPLGWAFYRDCIYVFLMRFFRCHIIYHMHGKGIREYVAGSEFRKKIYRWAFKGSSVICLAESLISDLSEVYTKRPYLVNNAIPFVSSASTALIKGKKSINVLFLSNLIISKGIFIFLDAISLLNKFGCDNINVSIIGREAELSATELTSEIQKRDFGKFVKYLGPKYNDEKNEIYSNTDVLIYPTCNDVWGLVILEAMQFGIPVVASREGAIPEIVDDGITGFLVDKYRPDQIADKLKILIKDPLLRNKMGEAGRKKFLERYTLDIFEKNMVAVFQDVIKSIDERN